MRLQPPLSYRWLRANGVSRLVPWHFIDESEGQFASAQFATENPSSGSLYTFARRQDCDDFAGFTIVEGHVTDQVIYYHPSFSGGPNRHIISGTYPDLWTFLREVVIPDTANWFTDEADIKDIEDKEN
jgi:hypothetical protein